MKTTVLNKFGFTACVDEEATPKILLYNELENILNVNVDLSDYTKKTNELVFVFIALNPGLSYTQENFIKERRKTGILELGINLNHSQLLQSTDSEAVELLAEAYLKGIDQFLQNRKDFDGKRFYTDVKRLFIQHGLVKDEVKKSA